MKRACLNKNTGNKKNNHLRVPSVLLKTNYLRMKPKIRILHVDDSFHDRILIQDALEKEQDEYEVIAADSREKFEKYLLEYEFDLVLSDFNILGFDGLRVLDIVKNKLFVGNRSF